MGQSEVNYVDLEVMDMFPHDHPLLDEDRNFSELAAEMSDTLNTVVKNSDKNDLIHAYLFVYDASKKQTFQTLWCLIETIREIEKSERRGKKGIQFTPLKMVLGNKKDLKTRKRVLDKADVDKLENKDMRIRFKEVSALTNQGVQKAFKTLISDITGDSVLNK
mmetsp:Transcript_26944/g.20158  ORF Transcript_26944/g.20158 Transcript_26944/m.20158 type:complete len:163 (+) Transcript_26944:211-699(+)